MPEVAAGHYTFTQIVAALRSGEGVSLSTDLAHASLYHMSYAVFSSVNSEQEYTRIGNHHPNIVPYGVYSSKEGTYFVIAPATDSLFKKLITALGIQESEIPKWQSNRDRVSDR